MSGTDARRDGADDPPTDGIPAHDEASDEIPPDEEPADNPDVNITDTEVLSDSWYTLRRITFEYRDGNGEWSTQQREAYDRGNGATVLLVDWERRTIVLTRQFRVPAYTNGHPDGMLIESAAGLLDDEDDGDAEATIRREAEEETGYRVGEVRRLFELFMSPGSVTERVAFYVAEYTPDDRIAAGGGLEHEGEDIEVLELDLDIAASAVADGSIVDAKTVVLIQWAQLEAARRAVADAIESAEDEEAGEPGDGRDR